MKQFKSLCYNCFFLLIIFLIIPRRGFAQQYIQEFSHIGKITFPSKPKSKSIESDTSYTLREQTNLYTFVIHSFRNDPDFSIDSGSNDLKKLYRGFIKQLKNDSNISLIYKDTISINGLKGIEIKYTIKSPRLNISYTCYHRILYVNRTIYNYGFSTLNDSDKTNLDKRDEFLNSFLITEKKENLYQFYEVADDHPVEKGLAKITANIIIYGIIILVLYLVLKGLKDFFWD
jgi:hypothetical protein